VPLVLLFDLVSANFPNHFSIVIGVAFIAIVYFLPDGVVGFIERWRAGALRLPATPPVPDAGGALLELIGVSRAFGGLQAVDGMSLSLARGEILGLIGPNGSGKTTALNLISGELRADSGEIRFKGRDITRLPSHQIARLGVARTFQLVRALGSLSCRENVIAGLAFRSDALWGERARAKADELLDRVGLLARADLPAANLSYIDQKRLELARALALDPELLLLDEWLAGLNPTELAIGIELVRSLRRDGLTIVLVEHVMDAIRSLCDRCVVMTAGRKIADGVPALVLAEQSVIAAYLGEAVDA
jgi:branched-chain amino acid transport system permease protein